LYKKVGQPEIPPQNFELPFNGQLSENNRSPTFSEWVQKQFTRALETGLVTEKQLASAWLIAYTESLAQKH